MPAAPLYRALLLVAFAAGLAFGCKPADDDPDHCWKADGDATCQAEYGDARPFCVAGPASANCPGVDANNGCVADQPSDECWSPCGGETNLLDDDTCLGSCARRAPRRLGSARAVAGEFGELLVDRLARVLELLAVEVG